MHFTDFLGKISELKSEGVKVILGVGGLKNSRENNWSEMVAVRDNRKTFIESALSTIKRWKFDGLHIAWQYPVCGQVNTSIFNECSSIENILFNQYF